MDRQHHRTSTIQPAFPPPPLPLSAQSAIDWVGTWSGNPVVLRDIASALRAVARMVGLPPGAVMLTPESLRGTLFSRSATGYGISESRMRNVLADLRRVLRFADVIDPVEASVADVWQSLVSVLDERKRAEVIGFARFCSLRQIRPEDVTATTLQAFEDYITARTLTPNPRRRVGILRSFWNRAGRTVQGWPGTRIEGGRRHDYVLPLEEFSQGFRDDLAAFGASMSATSLDLLSAGDDDLDDGTLQEAMGRCGRPVRATTRDLRMAHVRWAASAAVASGLPLTEINCVADLVVPLTRAKAILRFLYERASGPSAAGMHVGEVLRIVARHHAKLAAKDVSRIKAWGKPVRLEYHAMTERNERLVLEAIAPARDKAMLGLPNALSKDATKLLAKAPTMAVSLMMRAVAIGILNKTPLRLGELAGLRLDQHLHRPDPKLPRITHLSLQRTDRKAPVPYSVTVSKDVGELLERWIRTFRPLIAAPGCVYLFPGWRNGNRPMTPQGVRHAIKTTLWTRVGVELTPHTFRHVAAHHLLHRYPGQYGLVQSLLGHKDPTTARRAYIRLENEAAHQLYDDVVLSRKTRPSKPRLNERR